MRIESVIAGNNAALIASAAKLWIHPTDIVLDPTYGRGRWWTVYRPEHLIVHDLTVDGVDFRELPEPDASVDVVTFDPPYISTGNKATSTVPDLYERYGLGQTKGWQATFDLIAAGMVASARVLKPGGRLLVKCCDYVESGQRRFGHHHVVSTALHLGLVQVDEFIHHSGPGPQPSNNLDGSPRRQVHARQAHSFLCVFKKPGPRTPARAVSHPRRAPSRLSADVTRDPPDHPRRSPPGARRHRL